MNDKKIVLNKKAAGKAALAGGIAGLLLCLLLRSNISELIATVVVVSLFGAVVGAISE